MKQVSAGDLVLTSPRRSWIVVAAACAGFVMASALVMIADSPSLMGWIAVVFFGIGLVVAVAQVLVPSRLIVSPTQIEIDHMGRRWVRDLASCSEFEVWRNPIARQELVVFDHPVDAGRRSAAASRRLSGRSSALPDTYGLKAAELARILNERRS